MAKSRLTKVDRETILDAVSRLETIIHLGDVLEGEERSARLLRIVESLRGVAS